MSTIVINDTGDLHRLDATWSELRRDGGQVQLNASSLRDVTRIEIERDLNRALDECGCHQGAIGVVAFSLLAAAGVLMPGRRSVRASGGLSAATELIWRAATRIVGAAMVGGVVGKGAGLAAARSRFARQRRRLRAELELIDGNGVR